MTRRPVSMALLLALAAAGGARADTGDGPYALAGLGATRYGFDCWATPLSCEGGTGRATKIALGWARGNWALEGQLIDFGRASTEASIASLPGETIRLRAAGLSVVGLLPMQGALRLSGRLGVARTRHERSRETPVSTWAPSAGLGLQWSWSRNWGLEFAWDLCTGEGSDSGTGMGNAFTLGLRLGF